VCENLKNCKLLLLIWIHFEWKWNLCVLICYIQMVWEINDFLRGRGWGWKEKERRENIIFIYQRFDKHWICCATTMSGNYQKSKIFIWIDIFYYYCYSVMNILMENCCTSDAFFECRLCSLCLYGKLIFSWMNF